MADFTRRSLVGGLSGFALLGTTALASAQEAQRAACPIAEPDLTQLIWSAVGGGQQARHDALEQLVACDVKGAISPLILGMRHLVIDDQLVDALEKLTGERLTSWHEAMLWQEGHPEIVPHSVHRDMKLRIFNRIDPRFMRFLGEERSLLENMRIRLEEITWGGVVVDGIPSLDNPTLIEATEADYLGGDNLVFGVSINGDSRAYPLRIMGWHEMFNEVIGGVPVALAYCTLCGAGILYETDVEGRDAPFVFGSSGFLYRSNKLMFDRETDSLWNQFTGEPVTGPLVDSGIRLKTRPVIITTWDNWRASHPDTKVLAVDTGFRRDYGEGVVYNQYFSSPDLMFPALVDESSGIKAKDYVFGIRDVGVNKAWPLKAFEQEPVINDAVGGQNVVLIGDAKTRTVRAYQRADQQFSTTSNPTVLTANGSDWQVTEDALESADGTRLARVPGHIAYWFGWNSYFGLESELYDPAKGG